MALFARSTASLCQNFLITLVFKKNAIFITLMKKSKK
jgi:hypothetical protein